MEARVSTEADDSLHFVLLFFWVAAATLAKCDSEATVRNGVGIKMDYTLKTEKLKSGCLRFRPGPQLAGLAWSALIWPRLAPVPRLQLPQLVLLLNKRCSLLLRLSLSV